MLIKIVKIVIYNYKNSKKLYSKINKNKHRKFSLINQQV